MYIYTGGPVDSWRKILNLNVLGLSICTKEAIESMNERGVAGHVIHINRLVML
jgi:NADP+-dependent farnesol dehydrogenase